MFDKEKKKKKKKSKKNKKKEVICVSITDKIGSQFYCKRISYIPKCYIGYKKKEKKKY